MAITKTFKSGNYNTAERWGKEVIPSKFNDIRYTIIPRIDQSLIEMLGSSADIVKESLNIFQSADKEGLHAFVCNLVYIVDDFKVEDAPKEAINEDEQKLRQALEVEGAHLKTVNIDVKEGKLNLVYELPLE